MLVMSNAEGITSLKDVTYATTFLSASSARSPEFFLAAEEAENVIAAHIASMHILPISPFFMDITFSLEFSFLQR